MKKQYLPEKICLVKMDGEKRAAILEQAEEHLTNIENL